MLLSKKVNLHELRDEMGASSSKTQKEAYICSPFPVDNHPFSRYTSF